MTGALLVNYLKNKDLKESRKNTTKYLSLFRVMNQYVVTKQEKRNVADYFRREGYKTVGIYGMSHIGQRLIDDLKETEIEVKYGIDQRADRLTYELDIYKPDEEFPQVDVIVVTAFDFDEVEKILSKKVSCDIVAFDEIIFNL